MRTIVAPCDPESIQRAAGLIRSGALVAFPTETVYGLGANGLNGQAVLRIFEAKGRPADNPLILHVSRLDDVLPLIDGPLPDHARRLADAFWPGPLRDILPSILGNLVRMSLCTVVLLTPLAAAQARTVAPYSSM